jgi:hypothetical protein
MVVLTTSNTQERPTMATNASLGPAGEILRLAGHDAAHLHDEIHAALREGLGEYDGRFGVRAPASTWIVSAAVA